MTPSQVAVLWTELPAYLCASLNELRQRHNVVVFGTQLQSALGRVSLHRWTDERYSRLDDVLTLPSSVGTARRWRMLHKELRRFRPDVLLVSGWSIPEYILAVVWARRTGVTTVCCFDTHWTGKAAQRARLPLSRAVVRAFDFFWVPGSLQAAYAARMGARSSEIWRGLYCCDTKLFAMASKQRRDRLRSGHYPRRFLFIGTFHDAKGIRPLQLAYRRYRQAATDPWELHCVGGGPLADELAQMPGVSIQPFVQPNELADIYSGAGVFVLASLYDAHGVVVHEAATVGLPLLCSSAAGASCDFVRDGYNGYLFDPHDVSYLSRLMTHMSSGQVDLLEMGERSRNLAAQLTADRWADYFVERLRLKTCDV